MDNDGQQRQTARLTHPRSRERKCGPKHPLYNCLNLEQVPEYFSFHNLLGEVLYSFYPQQQFDWNYLLFNNTSCACNCSRNKV